MDSPFDFDRVKIEKANAIARYRFFKYISTSFKLFAVLTFISWSSTRLPAAVKFTGECLSACLSNSHAVFLLGNLLVFALYVLSRHPDKNGSESHADNNFRVVDSPEPSPKQQQQQQQQQLTEDSTGDENAVVAVPEMMESEPPARTKEVERFQRTQSEKSLKREEAPPPNRELRRSVTERWMSVVVLNSGDRRPRRASTEFESVDRLSNEEFRLAVEAFISKQRTELGRKLF